MTLRNYVEAKRMVENQREGQELPDSPLIDLVWAFKQEQSEAIRMARHR